ncbi:hypothetical protein [Streptomyces sp. NPDC001970]
MTETPGHSTITMTLDTYAHVMQTALRAAAERVDDALGVDETGRYAAPKRRWRTGRSLWLRYSAAVRRSRQ